MIETKQACALRLLQEGSIMIYIDARRSGVLVPRHYRDNHKLVLQFAYDLPLPIRDLSITDHAISGTLSFNREPYWCTIPWSSVYAIMQADGDEQQIWASDAPPEVRKKKQDAKPEHKRPHLRLVK